MTPEREREIRKIAGREGQTWRSSAVSLVALNEVLDELERIRGAADGLEKYVTMRRDDTRDSLRSGFLEGAERWCAAREGDTLTETLDKGRELGLWE